MGRTIPVDEITTIHPVVSITLTFIWMAALVTTISSLCGLWSKKGSKSSSADDKDATKDSVNETTTIPPQSDSQPQMNDGDTSTTEDDQFSRPLPPPPSATKLELGDNPTGKMKPKIDKTSSLQNYMSKTTSRRKLTSSISMRMSTKIKDKASEFKGKASEFKDKASDLTDLRKKHENESLWQKRIILGERCRLPNQEEEVLLTDEQGNKVITRPNTQIRKATSLSRSCSSIDHRVITSMVIDEEVVVKDKGKGKEKLPCGDADA